MRLAGATTKSEAYIAKLAKGGYAIDPHTATCFKMVDASRINVITSTAHWVKFTPSMIKACQIKDTKDEKDALAKTAKILNDSVPSSINSLFSAKNFTQKYHKRGRDRKVRPRMDRAMIIIPARLASTRFSNKILKEINGVPMFVATALIVSDVDDVAVAVDEPNVLDIAKAYGIKAVLTSKDHQSGTDRINEAAQILGLNESEIIINVQADEPFIEPENIANLGHFASRIKKSLYVFLL